MVLRHPDGVIYRYFPPRFRMLMFPSLVVIHPRSYTRRITSPMAVSIPASCKNDSQTSVIGYFPKTLEGWARINRHATKVCSGQQHPHLFMMALACVL